MASPHDPALINELRTTRDGWYHVEVLPGEIHDLDGKLDELAQNGWDLVDIYGRGAVFKSRTVTGQLNVDAFGRSKSSVPFTIGDYKLVNGKLPDTLLTASSANGTVIINGNEASIKPTITVGASGSYALVQSKKYHNYMPGKSQFILQSFVLGNAVNGSIKRVGYFDDFNGIFLEQDATGSLNWVIRSDTSGTVSETRVAQSDWNIRTLSADPFIFDVTKTQLLFIDFQWLGVGRVRCGFVNKGEFVLTHVFDHTNVLDKVYIRNPNLPIRTEVRNTTTTSADITAICGTVISEGGAAEAGRTWSVGTDRFLESVASASVNTPLMAIQLKSSINGFQNRTYVRLIDTTVYAKDRSLMFRVFKLPNRSAITTGSAWESVNDDSAVEYTHDITSFTSSFGRELLSGFVPAAGTGTGNFSSAQGIQQSNALQDNYIAQNIDSTNSEIYIVTVTNLTGDATTAGVSMQWGEVS